MNSDDKHTKHPSAPRDWKVKMKHGSYIGQGCPAPHERAPSEDGKIFAGFEYDHEHPARPGEVVRVGDERTARRMVAQGVAELVD